MVKRCYIPDPVIEAHHARLRAELVGNIALAVVGGLLLAFLAFCVRGA